MTLVSSSIPNLVGGVSQQPPALRLSTTAEKLENAWPSVVSGLLKRPPTVNVANVDLTLPDNLSGFLIDRNPAYRYLVVVVNGDLKVVDLNTGLLQAVTFPDTKAYLTAASPKDSFRFVTVGDFTFITNRNTVVGTSAVSEPVGGATRLDPATRGTVYVAAANANTYYSIYINGVLKAKYLSPKGTEAASSVPDTSVIAEILATQLTTANTYSYQSGESSFTSLGGYTVTRTGSTLVISNLASGDTIQMQGGTGDKSLKGFKDTVQSFSDLPPNAPEGLIVRVQGDVEEAGDDYYVVYRKGKWEETVAYGAGQKLDAATMPHVLVRESSGSWTFKKHVWSDRIAGDAESNKPPSFVGVVINDIFVYTNRLGVLADENVILSESDLFENFYRVTCAQTLDSDRIDVAVLHNNVDILQHAVPFNRDLLLVSDSNQFRFSYANFLSPKNAQVRYSTSFNVSPRIRPVNMGTSLYLVDDRPDYKFAKVLEYYPKENVTADDATEVTSPVPEFIPNDITFLAASNRTDALVISSASDPKSLFFYKFFWQGDRKVQSSWNKWVFNDCTKIHWANFSGAFLYLLIQRPDGVFLERMRFDEDVFTSTTDYELLMDRRATPVMSYIPSQNITIVTTPYPTFIPMIEIVSSGGGTGGIRHTPKRIGNGIFQVDGNISTKTVVVGIPYTLEYEMSPIYMRQAKGQGEVVVLDGRLQLRYVSVEFHDTAFFKAHVKLPSRDEFIKVFDANTVGSPFDKIGVQSFDTGTLRIPVMSKSLDAQIRLTNDSPFPSAFGSAEWQGDITMRARKRV